MAPNHFTRVELTNFKGHVHTDVPLSQFTLLVGANGTGKTSVLEAIRLVIEAFVTSHGAFGSKSEDLLRDGLEVDLIRRSFPDGLLSPEGADLQVELDFGEEPSTIWLLVSPRSKMFCRVFTITSAMRSLLPTTPRST